MVESCPRPARAGGVKAMKSALASLLTVLAASAQSGEGAGPYSFTLSGKAFDERCVQLDAGQAIRYRFESSGPVDFNIHTHRGADVFYPVKKSGVRETGGTYKADRTDGYCLMWEHRGTGSVTVQGNLETEARR
jgi:hypothetical protein